MIGYISRREARLEGHGQRRRERQEREVDDGGGDVIVDAGPRHEARRVGCQHPYAVAARRKEIEDAMRPSLKRLGRNVLLVEMSEKKI